MMFHSRFGELGADTTITIPQWSQHHCTFLRLVETVQAHPVTAEYKGNIM